MGEAGILFCLRASPPPSMAPEGLAAGAGARGRPACPARLPWSLATVTWPGRTSFRPCGITGLESSRVGGWGPGPQLPAYLLWEPSTQPSLADDLLCTSSGHPAMGQAGPDALQPLF